MPVVITAEVENFNAYWSSGYYNHIVIFDTAVPTQLAVFSEDLLSTFKHELTHAFTYNMKNKFWLFLSHAFGDFVNGGIFSVSSGWAEGAAVLSESDSGEGRLNSDYSKQMVRQAKIENQFPHYQDMQGEADHLPSGSWYYFNGAFNLYLKEKYGMEKYARLWYSMINARYISAGAAFKKIYGKKLYDEWYKFMDWYPVPDVIPNPVAGGIVKDFFAPENPDYSINNERGSRFQSLSSSSKGVYYVDSKTNTVYFTAPQSSPDNNSKINKTKPVFTIRNLIEAKTSSDGKYIVFSYYDINKANVKIRTGIFCPETKQIFKLDGTGLKNPAIIQDKEQYYIAALHFHSQDKELELYKLNIEKDSIKSAEKLWNQPLEQNADVSYLTDSGNGTFSFIYRKNLEYSIRQCNIRGQTSLEYKLPEEKIVLQDLNYNPETNEFLFSYTTPNQMPQLGKLNLNSKNFNLWEKNLSGGVFSPILYKSAIVYAGNFYQQNRLFTKTESEITYTIKAATVITLNSESGTDEYYNSKDSIPYTPFHKSKYFFKGGFIPVSTMQSVSYDPDHLGSYYLPLGITFLTNNVWDGSQTSFTAGYGPQTNSFGTKIDYSSGTSTSLFTYSLSAALEVDGKGFKQTTDSITLKSAFMCGPVSALGIGNATLFHYGRSNKALKDYSLSSTGLFNGAVLEESPNFIYGINQTQINFSTMKKTGPGRFEDLGFSASALLYWDYNGTGGKNPAIYKKGADAGLSLLFYLPKLLPVKNKAGYVTNLPARISFNLFTSPVSEQGLSLNSHPLGTAWDFAKLSMASAGIETVLFQKDIQKTIKFLPLLFANDFRITLNYHGGFDYNSKVYYDQWKIAKLSEYFEMIKDGELQFTNVAYIKFTIGLTPSFGGAADSEYKQLICIRAGISAVSSRVIPVCNVGMDYSF